MAELLTGWMIECLAEVVAHSAQFRAGPVMVRLVRYARRDFKERLQGETSRRDSKERLQGETSRRDSKERLQGETSRRDFKERSRGLIYNARRVWKERSEGLIYNAWRVWKERLLYFRTIMSFAQGSAQGYGWWCFSAQSYSTIFR